MKDKTVPSRARNPLLFQDTSHCHAKVILDGDDPARKYQSLRDATLVVSSLDGAKVFPILNHDLFLACYLTSSLLQVF